MRLTERIAVIIDSVHQGAVRGLNSVGREVGGLAPKTRGANLALAILNRTGLASTQMGQKLTANINQTGTAMGGLKASGIGVGQVLGVGVATAAVAAGAALTKFALDGVEVFGSATGEVRALQRVMGGSMESASKLRFAARLLGVDLGTVEKSAGLLAKSIGNGSSKLKDYGVEIVRTKDGNVDMAATIANVAQAFQSTEDPAKRAAIGAAAFGRGWQQMVPILSKSKAELRDIYAQAAQSHQIFSKEDTEQGRKFALATRELNEEITGLKIELGKGLVPVLTEVTHGFSEVLEAGDDLAGMVGTDLGDAFGTLVDGALDAIPPVNALRTGLDWLSDDSDDAKDSAKEHAKSEENRAAALKTTADAATHAEEAVQGLIDVGLAQEAALRALDKATDTYNEALWESTAAGGKNTEASKKLDDATFALKEQINSTAQAVAKNAVAHSTLTDKTALAKAGNDAYRGSLMQAANSEIPAVRNQALTLIDALDQASKPHNITVTLDTYQAHNALNGLRTKWDSLQNAMGQVGPTRS